MTVLPMISLLALIIFLIAFNERVTKSLHTVVYHSLESLQLTAEIDCEQNYKHLKEFQIWDLQESKEEPIVLVSPSSILNEFRFDKTFLGLNYSP